MKKRLVLGVDFDGTIVEEAFPNIGAIKPRTVDLMKKAIAKGHLVIVWTARSGVAVTEATNFLHENNIPFHYINENPEDPWAIRGEQGRKIFCDFYLDDRAVHIDDIDKVFKAINEGSQPKLPAKAKLRNTFSTQENHGEDYPYDTDDLNTFEKGDIVEVLKEATPNEVGRLYVIYNEKINESTVVHKDLLEFLE